LASTGNAKFSLVTNGIEAMLFSRNSFAVIEITTTKRRDKTSNYQHQLPILTQSKAFISALAQEGDDVLYFWFYCSTPLLFLSVIAVGN
jgi:hypothetical protein